MGKNFKNYLLESWHSLTVDYRTLAEGPYLKSELIGIFRQSSLPVLGYYLLLSLATVIGTFGLIGNSSATIIGAMIIAPLMNPIITLAFGITTRERRLIDRGLLVLVTSIPLVIGISYIFSKFIGIQAIDDEVLMRINPSYLDMGVAFGSGAAAAFAYSRKSISSTLPGVAVSVALVPPLCVVGIGLHSGDLGQFLAATEGIDEYMAWGAMNLFLTNLWGIIFASITVFAIQGYGSWRKVAYGLIITVALMMMLIAPLGDSFHKMRIRELLYQELLELGIHKDAFSETGIHKIKIRLLEKKYVIQMMVTSSIERLGSLEEADANVNKVANRLSEKLGHPVAIELNVIPTYHISSQAKPS